MTCDIPEPLVTALRDARHLCILTGAGVSAESGVPTFREAQDGLWSQYRPEELATPEAFLADPVLIWRWYRWRRDLADCSDIDTSALAELNLKGPAAGEHIRGLRLAALENGTD